MSDISFDPKSIFESYRNAFAPALKAQQEGVKALDRVGRYQYAVAGDYLEWSLAQAKALLDAQSPTELVSKQQADALVSAGNSGATMTSLKISTIAAAQAPSSV